MQGFYGYQGGISFNGSGNVYSYGNDYSTSNTSPSTRDWGNNINGGTRRLSSKSEKTFGLSIGGFAGVEYFIMPKFSIGGELSTGLGFNRSGKGKIETESWNAVDSKVEKVESVTGGSMALGLSNSSGSLYMNFYF